MYVTQNEMDNDHEESVGKNWEGGSHCYTTTANLTRVWSSGSSCCGVWGQPDVSEEHITSIFRVEE
jgi:hypothetical protein